MNLSNDIINLFKLFNNEGFKLYIIGGAVRDYLLNRHVEDYDFATNATPYDMIRILDGYVIDAYQAKLGSIKIHINNQVFEITTFRKEYGVRDLRYPLEIEFVNSLKDDVLRRDFTINSLAYSPDDGVVDCLSGIEDLNNHLIKFNKDSYTSVLEDPIRIIRALRFSLLLNFKINDDDLLVLQKNSYLVNDLGKIKYDELLKLFKIKDCKKFIIKYFDIYKNAYPIFNHQLFVNVLNSDLNSSDLKYVLAYLDNSFNGLNKEDMKIVNGLININLNDIDLYHTKLLMIEYQSKLYKILNILECLGFDIRILKEFVKTIQDENHCLKVGDLAITYKDLENLDISKKDYGKIFKYLLDVVLINEKFNDKDMLIEIVKKGDYK